MVEHAFRHLYIHTRALNEDSDAVGEEYYGELNGSEDLASVRKINNYTNIVHQNKTAWNMGEEHNNNISKVGGKFGLSNIFYYIIGNFNHEKEVIRDGMKNYLLDRLKQYTMLSSYVHGGPYAEMCHEELIKDNKKRQTHIESIVSESFGPYQSVVETTHLFAYLHDEAMLPHWEAVRDIGKQEK